MHKYTVYVEDVLGNKIAYILRKLKQLFVNRLINDSCIWMTKSDVSCGVVQLIGVVCPRS
jgi:hypothetical protein